MKAWLDTGGVLRVGHTCQGTCKNLVLKITSRAGSRTNPVRMRATVPVTAWNLTHQQAQRPKKLHIPAHQFLIVWEIDLLTSQVNTGAHLLQDVHNNLADVVQVCDAKKKQTNYLRNLTSDLARGNRGPICNNFCSYNIISLSHHPHQYTIVCLHTQEISFSVLTHCWCTLYADNTQNTPTMHIRIHNHTHIHFVLHLHTLSQHLHTQYTQVSFPAVGVDTRHLQVWQ